MLEIRNLKGLFMFLISFRACGFSFSFSAPRESGKFEKNPEDGKHSGPCSGPRTLLRSAGKVQIQRTNARGMMPLSQSQSDFFPPFFSALSRNMK